MTGTVVAETNVFTSAIVVLQRNVLRDKMGRRERLLQQWITANLAVVARSYASVHQIESVGYLTYKTGSVASAVRDGLAHPVDR